MKNPYEILGIPENATDTDVKKAYRELSRKYHPDNFASAEDTVKEMAEEKFKEVQEAYTKVMDMRSRGETYQQNQSVYGNGTYQNNPYNQQPYQGQRYDMYGSGYGRDPYGSSGCGTGNCCCDLWCADTLCECMGGDLCSCM